MKAIRRRFLDFFGVGTDDQTDSRPSSVRFKCTAQQVHSLRLGRSLMGTMYTGNEHEDESKELLPAAAVEASDSELRLLLSTMPFLQVLNADVEPLCPHDESRGEFLLSLVWFLLGLEQVRNVSHKASS